MPILSCKLVYDEGGTAAKSDVNGGQITFMRYDPINFLSLINE
jgi:hypothetical protein